VDPERLQLHGFAPSRSHDLPLALGVHPGERLIRSGRDHEPIRVDVNVRRNTRAVSIEDLADGLEGKLGEHRLVSGVAQVASYADDEPEGGICCVPARGCPFVRRVGGEHPVLDEGREGREDDARLGEVAGRPIQPGERGERVACPHVEPAKAGERRRAAGESRVVTVGRPVQSVLEPGAAGTRRRLMTPYELPAEGELTVDGRETLVDKSRVALWPGRSSKVISPGDHQSSLAASPRSRSMGYST
jgi:hypothetical protein